MKLTGFLIMTGLLQLSISGSGQTVKFSGKDVPLVKIFAIIKTQTGTLFFYDKDLIKEAKPVTVDLRNVSLETALNEIFRDQPLTWVLEDKTVTIGRAPASSAAMLDSASLRVKGTITDVQGNPVTDVTVMVKGKKQGTIADKNGKFSIKANPKDILVFSSVSYRTRETTVQNEEMNIELQLEIKPLESLIVGGNLSATKRKADATSVTVLDSKTLEKIPVNTLDQVFRGWVPGANSFDVGSEPEGFPTVSLRGASGANSLTAIAVYVDGIEYAGGSQYLFQLDKTNIDRIEIVKGPGAATMFGTGSNGGVIQIFTKKARPGENTVNFTTSAGFSKSKWVKNDPFQQIHSLETRTALKNVVLTLGGAYRTAGASLPDGGQKNKGFYASAKSSMGKFQAGISGRYNVRTFSISRPPFYDTAVHPRTDLIIEPAAGVRTPLYLWLNVIPTTPRNKNGITETLLTGINLSHKTTGNWVNNLDAGYTVNDTREVPVANGTTPLQRQYYSEKYSTTTIRYSNVFNIYNNGNGLAAVITSGAEYKKYKYFRSYTRATAAATLLIKEPDNENYGVFVQANPSYRNVYLTLGMRYEKNKLFRAAWNPRLGLTTNFDINSLIVKPRISWGKGITSPSYQHRFGHPPNNFTVGYANPDIKPQSQQGFDYGLELYHREGKFKLEVVYYDNILQDMIALESLGRDPVDTSLFASRYKNVSKVANKGWEFSGEFKKGRFKLQGTFSIIKTGISDSTGSHIYAQLNFPPGTRLFNLPRHTAGFCVTYDFFKLFGKADKGAISLNVTEVDGVKSRESRSYLLDVAYGRLPYTPGVFGYDVENSPVFRVGIYSEYHITNDLRFFIQGYNILNDYKYEFSSEYPTQGASWLFGFKYNFVKTNLGN